MLNWHSPVPIQRKRLEQKRRQFWKEAALEGGRPQVWQAIQAALAHPDLRTTILHSANIQESYKERGVYYDWQGWKYIVPNYCLNDPDNAILLQEAKEAAMNGLIGETALIDDYADDTSARVQLWNGKVYRVSAGQTVQDLVARLPEAKDKASLIVLRLGKVLPSECILERGSVYQVFHQ